MSTSQTKKNNFSITTTLRTTPVPSQRTGFSFAAAKEAILGKDYNLSLVFIGNTLSKRLNSQYKHKNRPTDILSFPLSETEGEIFLNIPYIRRSYKKFHRSYLDHVYFLFIHGLLHLKGYEHGSRMEHEENRYCKQFGIKLSDI